jgi:lipopolysaccharide transport system ATP-binding protein
MSQVAIVSEALSKRYRVPAGVSTASRSTKPRLPAFRRSGETTWIDAVADISFTIEQGEAVGVIGRNGAGKSTLLKLLSRVTRPTSGHADLYGQVGALLEVGTGFHPDLTGRENAFLSGAILGLSKKEIARRFDDIVDFAEITRFIDMPVKRYSSGMHARLGFAVAAFLRPSILIVDEVLAVGDIAFQAKCLAHMKQLSEDGTTVLFVSHNLLAVADFCPRALLMADGRLAFDGVVGEAIAEYRRSASIPLRAETSGAGEFGVVTVNGDSRTVVDIRPDQPLRLDLMVTCPSGTPSVDAVLNVVIEAPDGRTVMHLRSDRSETTFHLRSGMNPATVIVDELPLAPGTYWLWVRLVGTDTRHPVMWDSERITLAVAGDQTISGIVLPKHHFEFGRHLDLGDPSLDGAV